MVQKFAVRDLVWVLNRLDRSQGEPPGSWNLSAFLGPQFLSLEPGKQAYSQVMELPMTFSWTAKVRRERAASGVGSI